MSTTKPPKDEQEEEKPKERKNFSTPSGDKIRGEHRRSGLLGTLLATALGGGAVGSRLLAEKFLPTETRRALDNTTREYQRLLTSRALSGTTRTNDDVIQTYANQASTLASAPVAGMKGSELIRFLRTNLPIKDRWHPHTSDAHYDAFARGPAYGAAQIIDETADNIGKYYNPDKGHRQYMVEKFHPKFSEKLNATAAEAGAGPMDVGPSLRESLAYRGNTMDKDKQPGVMKSIVSGDLFNKDTQMIGRGFSDHYKQLKARLADELMTNSFKNYTGVGHKAKGVYNVLHKALPAVLGAAGVGVGGYGLVQLIKSIQRTKREKMLIAKAEREGREWTEKSAKDYGKLLHNLRLRRGECPACGTPDQDPYPPCDCGQEKQAMTTLRRALGRVVTNTIQPQGYDLRSKLRDARDRGLMTNLKAIWNDHPTYLDDLNAQPSVIRELPYRRMFDLPSRKFGLGYLTKNKPGSFRVSDKAADDLLNPVWSRAVDTVSEHPGPIPQGGLPVRGYAHQLFGNYGAKALSDTKTAYKDRWDFDLNPGEKVLDNPVNPVRWLMSKIVKPVTLEGVVDHPKMFKRDMPPIKSLAPVEKSAAINITALLRKALNALPSAKGTVDAVKAVPKIVGAEQDASKILDVTKKLDGEKTASSCTVDACLRRAYNETHTHPTTDQKAAGNYKKGRATIHGLNIAIENPPGSTRNGVGADGKKWSRVLTCAYGYFTDQGHVKAALWSGREIGVSDLAAATHALQSTDTQAIQALRRAGDPGMRKVGSILEFPQGHGGAPTRPVAGQSRQRRAIRSGELPLGDKRAASQQSTLHRALDLQGYHPVGNTAGAPTWAEALNPYGEAGKRLGLGARSDNRSVCKFAGIAEHSPLLLPGTISHAKRLGAPTGRDEDHASEASEPGLDVRASHHDTRRKEAAAPVGADGDAIDCFIGTDSDSEHVFVVDQFDVDGKFDEHKVMLCCADEATATKLYLSNYPKSWKLGPVSTTTVQQLKEWLKDGSKHKKPFSGQKVKAASAHVCGTNTCPECGGVSKCKCGSPAGYTPPPRVNTTNVCGRCAVEKKAAPQIGLYMEQLKLSRGTGTPFAEAWKQLAKTRNLDQTPTPEQSAFYVEKLLHNLRALKKRAATADEPSTIGKGLGTLFSDFVPYAPSGARRAGAASLMAERIKEDPGILLKYPILSQIVAMAGGGALAGAMSHNGASPSSSAAASVLPWLAVQAMKRRSINGIDRRYQEKKRLRLRDVDPEGMVDNALGSHRLGMAQAYDAMRNRKMRDIGALSEAADSLPVAMTLAGLGPAASLPFTQLIDQFESNKFMDKKADISDQRNSPSIPLYLAAAVGAGLVGSKVGDSMMHQMDTTPSLPRGEWEGMLKHVSGRPLLTASLPGLNNAFYGKPDGKDQTEYLTALVARDPNNLKHFNWLSRDPLGGIRERVQRDGASAFDPAFGKGSVIAHEGGHAKVEFTPGIARWLQRHAYPYANFMAPLASTGSMAAGLALKSPLKGLLAGTGIGLLGSAGKVVPEFMASKNGLEALKTYQGGKFQTKDDLKQLMTAFGTYASALTLPSMISGTLGGYVGKRRQDKQREQEERDAADQTPDNLVNMDENARNQQKAAGQ